MKYLYASIAVLALACVLTFLFIGGKTPTLGDAGVPNTLTNPTNTTVALNTSTSTLVLAANSGRLYASICTLTANTVDTFITISSKQNSSGTTIGIPALASVGIDIPKGTCYTINGSNDLTGMITAFASASNTLSVLYQ